MQMIWCKFKISDIYFSVESKHVWSVAIRSIQTKHTSSSLILNHSFGFFSLKFETQNT